MKRNYWEKMAPSYNDEIFDVLQNDKKALIRSVITKYASPKKTVIDIGCAIGKWLPVLSPAFKKVVAVDISAKNLAIAAQLYPQYKNVEYRRADMSGHTANIPACDFGICINAILTPSQKDRTNFFRSLSSCIRKGGRIVITIPSLESWLLTSIIQQQYKIDKNLFPVTKNAKEAIRKWNNIRQGNADIDDVPHKHYLKEELQLLLAAEGFTAEEFQKIEYDWDTEFIKPPVWLKEPKPWDWMV
ncbi:MAG: class I SAM-dependent methyltransferase, partial [Chitinophagaceae bacterium]|nr:class I SAM-dependent methyltransferase [Chitinophagaceae bacterium]